MNRVWQVLLVVALIWAAALMQRGAPLAPDELEFFRATRWIGEGRVPFRDFWEHHTPLQWIVFAPVARLFAGGPGVESVVAMRWAQVLLWIVIAAILIRLSRRAGVSPVAALALLVVSATFVRRAVEYRVDVVGNAVYFAALALAAGSARGSADRGRWIGFGALMSAAVLANMRLVPLVVVSALVALFWRAEERRWRWNPRALWMTAGVAAVAFAFIASLVLARAWTPFLDAILDYNVTSARLLEVDTFFDALLLPLWSLDAGGIAFGLAALAGAVLALRDLRSPGPLQVLALLAVGSVVAVASMEVQYDYHFQTTWLLLVPIVALALERLHARWQAMAALVAAVALAIFVIQIAPSFGAEIDYQNAVMTTADAVTRSDERVFDGAGFALRREPAYRYWFLTTGVRLMAARGLIQPYDAREMALDPPAAIIADYRLRAYLATFPRLARYATLHYVPLSRNLWVPGMTAHITRPSRVAWVAPRAGAYDVWASESLATHPWLTDPLQYAAIQGPMAPRYMIPLRRLPPVSPDALRWRVDGIEQPRGVGTLALKKGSRVELNVAHVRPLGVLLVPHGIGALCLAPADDFVF